MCEIIEILSFYSYKKNFDRHGKGGNSIKIDLQA